MAMNLLESFHETSSLWDERILDGLQTVCRRAGVDKAPEHLRMIAWAATKGNGQYDVPQVAKEMNIRRVDHDGYALDDFFSRQRIRNLLFELNKNRVLRIDGLQLAEDRFEMNVDPLVELGFDVENEGAGNVKKSYLPALHETFIIADQRNFEAMQVVFQKAGVDWGLKYLRLIAYFAWHGSGEYSRSQVVEEIGIVRTNRDRNQNDHFDWGEMNVIIHNLKQDGLCWVRHRHPDHDNFEIDLDWLMDAGFSINNSR
jgi:hypothetical protein